VARSIKRSAFRSEAISFRQRAVANLEPGIGVYALCDLDKVPIYVGQSVDGIRARVRRHLTSARSDIIANRQVDVWEIAWVMAWPTPEDDIGRLEASLFHYFNKQSGLMNGSVPALPENPFSFRPASQIVQVMSDEEIERRREPSARLPRQIEHYGRLVDHYLNVKSSAELRVSMEAHFARLARYHAGFLEQIGPPPSGSEDLEEQ
jgi:hypothetical protein